MNNILIMMVGLSRCGKSTFCKDNLLHYPIVNPDSIRLAIHGQRFLAEQESKVWYHTRIMIESLFLAGHKIVVLDATNINKKDRKGWKSDKWKRFFIHIDTPFEECMRRADLTNDEYIKPVIERMNKHFQPLTDDEFDIQISLNDLINNSLY